MSANGQKSKRKDGSFPSKSIKHDPNAESARAVFGKNGPVKTSSTKGRNGES